MQRVIRTFREWAKKSRKEQFAAILMMDRGSAWDDFEFQPTATTVHTKKQNFTGFEWQKLSLVPSLPDLFQRTRVEKDRGGWGRG